MMRGPRPKPTATRKREGNPGKRAFNPDEPALPTVRPWRDRVPVILVEDAVAASEWRRLAPLLRRARVLTDVDINTLLAYCQQWSTYQHALAKAPAEQRVTYTPNNYPVINPWLSIANKALLLCDRLGEQLGLTPSARTRVTTATPADEDAFAEFDDRSTPARGTRTTAGPPH